METMNNDIPYELLSQYFAGECSPEEKRRVEDWIHEDPAHERTVEQLHRVWTEAGKHRNVIDVDAFWRGVELRTIMPQKSLLGSLTGKYRRGPSTFNYVLRIAAVVVLSVAIPYLVYWMNQSDASIATAALMREVSTGNGERAQFRFSDGTLVWLNVASTMRFAGSFSGDSREVYLEGEAFFDVARNESMPFVVNTQTATVEVLGTEFDVHARADEKQIDVVVADGSVLLRRRGSGSAENVVLTKGFQSSLTENGVITPARPVNVESYTGWVNGRLVFDRRPIELALKDLERWYGLRCRLEGNGLRESLNLTATFENEPLEEVLHTIAVTTNLIVEQKGNEFVFSSNKKR